MAKQLRVFYAATYLQLVTSTLGIKPFVIKYKEYLWVKFSVKLNTNIELEIVFSIAAPVLISCLLDVYSEYKDCV